MKALLLFLLAVATAVAAPISFTTRSGQKLVHAELIGTDGIDATFSDQGGIVSVPLEDLSPEVQGRLHLDTSYAKESLRRDKSRVEMEKYLASVKILEMSKLQQIIANTLSGKVRLMNAKYFAPPQTELGVAHIGGLYAFSETDYLNEGADAARALGARCIKVSLSLDTDNPSPKLYALHSHWPEVATLDALAATPYYRALFTQDFDTFILTTFRPGRPAGYWRESFTAEDEQAEENAFAALTRYLLRTYAGTQKTFILQNWEGDWALRGTFDPATKPTAAATAAMIRWLGARQRGVARARAEFPASDARVFHACEVNLVRQAMEQGAPSVTTDVLPHIVVDLASYSAWDTKDAPAQFGEALAFIARHKQPTGAFGEHGVYVGEFGLPETGTTPEKVLARTTELLAVARNFGCPYAVYWELYCNEPIHTPAKVNADYKGFWLVRPDGTHSPVCRLFQE